MDKEEKYKLELQYKEDYMKEEVAQFYARDNMRTYFEHWVVPVIQKDSLPPSQREVVQQYFEQRLHTHNMVYSLSIPPAVSGPRWTPHECVWAPHVVAAHEHHVPVNVITMYIAQLNNSHKRFSDPVRRREKHVYETQDKRQVITTLCQLNYFRWCMEIDLWKRLVCLFCSQFPASKYRPMNIEDRAPGWNTGTRQVRPWDHPQPSAITPIATGSSSLKRKRTESVMSMSQSTIHTDPWSAYKKSAPIDYGTAKVLCPTIRLPASIQLSSSMSSCSLDVALFQPLLVHPETGQVLLMLYRMPQTNGIHAHPAQQLMNQIKHEVDTYRQTNSRVNYVSSLDTVSSLSNATVCGGDVKVDIASYYAPSLHPKYSETTIKRPDGDTLVRKRPFDTPRLMMFSGEPRWFEVVDIPQPVNRKLTTAAASASLAAASSDVKHKQPRIKKQILWKGLMTPECVLYMHPGLSRRCAYGFRVHWKSFARSMRYVALSVKSQDATYEELSSVHSPDSNAASTYADFDIESNKYSSVPDHTTTTDATTRTVPSTDHVQTHVLIMHLV